MPAHAPDELIPSAVARYVIAHLATALATACGDACLRWPGSYTDREKSTPYTFTRIDGKNVRRCVRPLLLPGQGQVVMTCATPGCINPNHMRRVMSARPRDIDQGRRTIPGVGNCYAPKTKPEDHAEIRRLIQSGLAQRDVAAKFGVSQSTISRIARSA